MADEPTVKPPPFVAWPTLLARIDRMRDEGIPAKIDKRYLADMADGTQFQYRQAFRSLGLTTSDDVPTPLLADLVHADPADRPEMFQKVMLAWYPELTALPSGATKDDFFAVLINHYGVTSDVQRRKMLTFFVAAADYARIMISPDIRPSKARTGPRKSARRKGTPARRPAGTAARTPAVRTDRGGQEASGRGITQRHVSFGDAGSVSIVVNVSWLDLPEEEFTKLRKLIKDIEALGESGS